MVGATAVAVIAVLVLDGSAARGGETAVSPHPANPINHTPTNHSQRFMLRPFMPTPCHYTAFLSK
jgi:hypothetical protein